MARFRPTHGVLIIALFFALVYVANEAWTGGFGRASFTRVSPGRDGLVRIDVGELGTDQVRFYRFLNYGNQEVKFFVGRDDGGIVHVAFDANEVCYKLKRGYTHQNDWLVCNKCEKAFRLEEVNAGGGGCKPIPVEHQVQGDQLLLAEADLLKGWRYFR